MSQTQAVRRRKQQKVVETEETEELQEVNGELQRVIRRVERIRDEFSEPGMWKKILTSKRVMLSIGILVGFAACTLLLTNPPSSLSLLLEEYDLPTLGAAEVEWKELFSGNSPLVPWNIGRANFDGREFCVGEELSARGLRAKHP
ncbi:hypothetical protein FRC18_007501, partial [Serendipita sp. 400]